MSDSEFSNSDEVSSNEKYSRFLTPHPNPLPEARENLAAFTFAELMISLVIIAVITALLYPTIREISPNNNKQLFRSAYKTIELTVEDIISAREDITTPQKLCDSFRDRLNAVGDGNCGDEPAGGGAVPANITLNTSNGMRWWFQNYSGGTHTIYVDVNASNNTYAAQPCAGSANCDSNDPASFPWANGWFRNDNNTVRDTFKIEITSDGKVGPNDIIGLSHLRDESN